MISVGKVISGAVGATVLFGLINSITVIETGNVGIKSTLGQIEPEELKPGINFAVPIFQKIEPVFTKTILINYSGGQQEEDSEEIFNEVTLQGEDTTGLELGIDMVIEVSPQPSQMADMFIAVGREGMSKKVLQPIRSTARRVLGTFKAEEIMAKRKEVEELMRTHLNSEFSQNPYFTLENVQLKKIYLPIKVKDAIERVQLAKQEAVEQEQKIKMNKMVAESVKEKAIGQANAVREKAKAEADRIILEAEAQAKANKIISDSLTQQLIQQNTVDAWKSGGAQVPQFVGSDKSPFLFNMDLKK